MRRAVWERWALRIPEDAWQRVTPPPHLTMRFRIRDDATGRTLAVSRNADEALARAGLSAASAAIAAERRDRTGATAWIFGDIPGRKTDTNSGWATEHYPALHDEGDKVTLKLHSDPEEAGAAHALGVTRLLLFALEKTVTVPFRRARLPLDAALYLKGIDYADERIAADLLAGAVAETLVRGRPEVRTKAEFDRRLGEDRAALIRAQGEMTAILIESAAEANAIFTAMERGSYPEPTVDAVSAQLGWMLYRGFPRIVPLGTLRRYRRYLKGIRLRLERARLSPSGDASKEARFAPYWERYVEAARPENRGKYRPRPLQEYRWMLEEYRISLFAQELHTPEPVSPKRLDAKWAEATR